jgi:hypothetical protein
MLVEEMKAVTDVNWVPWPEKHYSKGSVWRVFPFLYTFPADTGTTSNVPRCCEACPKTYAVSGLRA